MKNLLHFTIDWKKYPDVDIGFLQLDPLHPVDELSIKKQLLFSEETKKYIEINDELKKIKFVNQIDNNQRKLINKFFQSILSAVISESNILWTSRFILNETNIFLPEDNKIEQFKTKKSFIHFLIRF